MNEGDGLDEVRRDVAAAHGLDVGATAFLHGATVSEIEDSASRFAALLGRRETSDNAEPSLAGLFADVARAQALRKSALVDVLVGRPQEQQPRDEGGRWTTGSFDGGARPDGGMPPGPESHGEWLGRILREKRADAGANFG